MKKLNIIGEKVRNKVKKLENDKKIKKVKKFVDKALPIAIPVVSPYVAPLTSRIPLFNQILMKNLGI